MSFSDEFFTKISNLAEKEKLLQDLASAQAEIVAKLPQPLADIFKIKINLFNSKDIGGSVIAGTTNLPENGQLIIQINLGGEKYYFLSTFTRKLDSIYLSADTDIFHLQRRGDFRLKFPTSYKAFFDLTDYNSNPISHSLRIIDISAGGIRIEIPMVPSFLKIDDFVKGEIKLPDRPKISVDGKIVHQTVDSEKKISFAGVHFERLSELAKNKLAALVMDLYRENFSRLQSKKPTTAPIKIKK